MSQAASSALVGEYERVQANATSNASKSMTDKDTFLKLLVAQMTNQDPLNPMDDKEFVSQLSQFTTVEELQNLNKTASGLSDVVIRSQTTNAVSLIGTAVIAKGDFAMVWYNNDGSVYVTPIESSIEGNAADVFMNVYATDSDGNPVGMPIYSGSIGAQKAGSFPVKWDGRDSNGNPVGEGTYVVSLSAQDHNGQRMLVTSKSAGVVMGVETKADGNHKLILDDGRTVSYLDVETVTYYNPGNGQTQTPDDGNSTDDNNNGSGDDNTGDTGGGGADDTTGSDSGDTTGDGTGDGTGDDTTP